MLPGHQPEVLPMRVKLIIQYRFEYPLVEHSKGGLA